MKKFQISIILILLVQKSYSQTNGVGINTSNPQGTFHVDAGKDNATTGVPTVTQQANDFIVISTGNVGIGTASPSQKLDVEGTVKIADGTQGTGKVLTSDASGNSSWKPLALNAIAGTWGTGTPVDFTSYGSGKPQNISLYTNNSITLPPGKWIVNFGDTATIGDNFPDKNINTSDGQLWCTGYLSDSSTSGLVTPDYLPTYGGQRGSGGSIGRGMNRTFVSGAIAINNQTAANKTYYLWANQELDVYSGSGSAILSVNGTATPGYWISVFGLNWERYFYAIPIQ